MILKKICFLFLLITYPIIAQNDFYIVGKNKESVTIPFKLVNNLIVIDAEVNGKKLSFLLDTGIEKTILFNLKFSDSLTMNNVDKIQLRGLGDGEPMNALVSKKNLIRLKDVINPNHTMYIIIDNLFDLSAKMGIDINGIIGGDLFKNFIVRINYSSKKITFYDPKKFKYKKCDKCITLPLDFYSNKPFINVFVENYLGEEFEVKLLIDSGGGDALWLFKNSHPKILIGENSYIDFLGRGLNGDIHGKRSKISKLKIGDFTFENAPVSYPDSTAILTTQLNKERNGTLGAEILKRFNIYYDYPGRKITLKKNGFFNDSFLYNKSGIEIVYGGEMLVKEKKSRFSENNSMEGNSITEVIYSYGLAYKPSYQISFIRDGSPAHIAGLMVGDFILEINGKPAYNKKMEEIIHILSQKEDKKIKLKVDRDGRHLKFSFVLKNMF